MYVQRKEELFTVKGRIYFSSSLYFFVWLEIVISGRSSHSLHSLILLAEEE